jgi:hypothetical protein
VEAVAVLEVLVGQVRQLSVLVDCLELQTSQVLLLVLVHKVL